MTFVAILEQCPDEIINLGFSSQTYNSLPLSQALLPKIMNRLETLAMASKPMRKNPYILVLTDGPIALGAGDIVDSKDAMALLIVILRPKDRNTAAFVATVGLKVRDKFLDARARHSSCILQESAEMLGTHDLLPVVVPAVRVEAPGQVYKAGSVFALCSASTLAAALAVNASSCLSCC